MKSQNKGKDFTRGAALLIVTAVIVKVIGALFKIPLASKNVLGDVGFGHFSLAYDLFSPFYSLAMAGLPIAVAKTVAESNALGNKSYAYNIFKTSRKVYAFIGIVAFLILAVFLFPYSYFNGITSSGIYSLIAVLPAVFFCSYMSSYRGYYEGMNNMYPTAISELIEALCKLILGLGFGVFIIKFTSNPALAAAGSIFGISLGTAIATLYLKLYYLIKYKNSETAYKTSKIQKKAMSKALLYLAVPIALASLAANVSLLGDALTLRPMLNKLTLFGETNLRGIYPSLYSGNSEIVTILYGIKGKAYTLFNLVPTFTSVIAVSAVPVISGFKAKNDFLGLRQNIISVIRLTSFITIPVAMGFIFAGDSIMALIYDSRASVEVGGNLLRLFGVAVFFAGFTIPLTGVLQSLGKQKEALYNIILGAAVKIILNLLLVPTIGININGAAISTIGCYAVITILHFILMIKELKTLNGLLGVFLKPVIAGGFCGVAAFLITMFTENKYITLLSIFVACFIYLIMLLLLKFFKKEDFELFPMNEKIIDFCQKHKILS